MKNHLALLGGSPVISAPLAPYPSMGEAEIEAVVEVMRSGKLSGFYGSWCDEFWGGPRVKEYERLWAARFGVPHAITVNSATSGLMAALGAVGIGPGDEVIMPPYGMSASAMAPLFYGGIPVFADIEPETFCLDPAAVRAAITPRTKAVLAVNLFGHPARLSELAALCRDHGLRLVEDNAQAPLAEEKGAFAGTIGDIGVFSLNYHKHVHTGEGGICVTRDDDLARRLQLIRNHGENVVEPLGIGDISNLVGMNLRMTELSAAVGIAQLERIDEHVGRREGLARRLSEGTTGLEGLTPPVVRPGCRHVSYIWALKVDETILGIPRERFGAALAAEGFPHFTGYVRPLYLLPVFQRRIAIGREGWPFTLANVRYDKGLCPVAERMHEKEWLGFETCQYDVSDETADRLVEAVRKVHAAREDLVT